MLPRPTPNVRFPQNRDDQTTIARAAGGDHFIPLRMRSEQGNDVVEIDQPEAIVGRHSSADVRVAGADVSRRHCQIAFVDGSWRVRDLGSLNGVFVNNERIDAAPLKVGDRLRMGNITYIIERSGAPKTPRRDLLKSIAQAFEGDGMTALG